MKKIQIEELCYEKAVLEEIENNNLALDRNQKLYTRMYINYEKYVNLNDIDALYAFMEEIPIAVDQVTKKYGFYIDNIYNDVANEELKDRMRMSLYTSLCKQKNFESLTAFWSYILTVCFALWGRYKTEIDRIKDSVDCYYAELKASKKFTLSQRLLFYSDVVKPWIISSMREMIKSRFRKKHMRKILMRMTISFLNNTLSGPDHYPVAYCTYCHFLQLMIIYLRILFKKAETRYGKDLMIPNYDDILFYYRPSWL